MDTHLAAPLRFAIRVSTACLLTASAPFFAGCVNVARTGPSEAMQLEARPVGFPDSVRAMGVAPLTVSSDLKGVTPWFREAAIKRPVNVLALSGGGAGGAFGAGSTPLEIQERAAQTHIRSTGDGSQCPSQNARWNSRPGQITQEVGERTGSELQRLDAAN